jgi:hypothetical protein
LELLRNRAYLNNSEEEEMSDEWYPKGSKEYYENLNN